MVSLTQVIVIGFPLWTNCAFLAYNEPNMPFTGCSVTRLGDSASRSLHLEKLTLYFLLLLTVWTDTCCCLERDCARRFYVDSLKLYEVGRAQGVELPLQILPFRMETMLR